MARHATKKNETHRLPAPLPESVIEARARAWGLPRFAVRLAAATRLKPSASPWARRVCD